MAELNQLKDLLNQKNDEIKDLKEKCLQIEQDAQEYVKSALEEIEAQIKIKIEREKADLMNQFARERLENEARERIFKQKINELEARIAFLTDENEKLNGLIRDLRAEVESLNSKCQSIDKLRQSDLEEFKYQIENLRRKIVIINFNI